MRKTILDNNLENLTIAQAAQKLSESDNINVKTKLRVKLQIAYGKLIATLKAGIRDMNANPKRWDRDARDGLWRIEQDARAVAKALDIPFGYATHYPSH